MTAAEVVLRPVTDADRDLLTTVFASTRSDLLNAVDWAPEQKSAFVAQQFAAQDHHYRAQYPDATSDVIEADGHPVGRVLVARTDTDALILDIALLPEARGRGVGGRVIDELLDEARRTGRSKVSLHVESGNPAKRLYTRLGFRHVEDVSGGVYELWEARSRYERGGKTP